MFKENWGTLGHCFSVWQDSHVSCFHGSYSLVGKAAVRVQKSASFQIALLQGRGTVLRTIRGQEEEPVDAETWKLTQGRVFQVRHHPWFLF